VSDDVASNAAASAQDARRFDASFVTSLIWTGVAKGGSQLISWVATFVVARLLTPEDYGLVGMAGVFLGIVTILSEFGLGVTIITLRDLTNLQVAQLNSVAVALGVACFAACCAAAFPLGWFFHSEPLPVIVVVLGITFPISAFRIVPNALLQKDLRFRRLALLETVNVLVLSLTMVILAKAGFRYWTLVAGAIVSSIVTTLQTIASQPVPFRWPKWAQLERALTFTRDQLGATLLWYWYSNADRAVAGKLLGPADLGVYSMAALTATSISEKVMMLLTRITPAYFSAPAGRARRAQALPAAAHRDPVGGAVPDPDRLRARGRSRRQPGSRPEVVGAIGPLRLLAISAAINSTTPLLARVLTVRGQNRYLLWIAVVLAIVMPISFVVGSQWGPVGIAAVWVTVFPLTRIPVLTRVVPSLGLTAMEYLMAFWPATSGVLAMAAAVLAVRAFLPASVPTARERRPAGHARRLRVLLRAAGLSPGPDRGAAAARPASGARAEPRRPAAPPRAEDRPLASRRGRLPRDGDEVQPETEPAPCPVERTGQTQRSDHPVELHRVHDPIDSGVCGPERHRRERPQLESLPRQHAPQVAGRQPALDRLPRVQRELGPRRGAQGARVGRGEDQVAAVHEQIVRGSQVPLLVLEVLDHLVAHDDVEPPARRFPAPEVDLLKPDVSEALRGFRDRERRELDPFSRPEEPEDGREPAGSAAQLDHARRGDAGLAERLQDRGAPLELQPVGEGERAPAFVVEGLLLADRRWHGRFLRVGVDSHPGRSSKLRASWRRAQTPVSRCGEGNNRSPVSTTCARVGAQPRVRKPFGWRGNCLPVIGFR
jgi:PST family polysaccharide transporter